MHINDTALITFKSCSLKIKVLSWAWNHERKFESLLRNNWNDKIKKFSFTIIINQVEFVWLDKAKPQTN